MGPGRLYINAPAIGALRLCSRRVASRAIAHGHFGRPIMVGRLAYVAIDRVESWFGCEFTPEQIEAAIGVWPTRSLTIEDSA